MKERWIKHVRLASTNSYVSDLVKQHALEEGTVVIADYQDAGRGTGTHSWVSNPGENLLMSMILFPAFLSASQQFQLSKTVSLALVDVLETLGIDAYIKWPNDILSSRGKIAGILIEHSITAGKISHTVAGIGLNLNQTEFPDFPLPASSLRLESGKHTDVAEVGELVEERLLSRYQDLKQGKTGRLEKEYLEKLHKAGISASFRSPGGTFRGIIKGVNEFGELLVLQGDEIRTYGHGSIHLEPESKRT